MLSEWAARLFAADIHQLKDTLCHSKHLTTDFRPGYQSLDYFFPSKYCKIHYNMVSPMALKWLIATTVHTKDSMVGIITSPLMP
jgi:hypothetical protein